MENTSLSAGGASTIASINEQLRALIDQKNSLEAEREQLTAQIQSLSTIHAKLQQQYTALTAAATSQERVTTLMRSILLHGFRELPWFFPDKPANKSAQPNPRRLIKTIGSTQEIHQNEPHSFAANHALYHYASNSIYTFIPKNACTSLRYSLALANGTIGGPDDFHWIHANNQAFAAGTLKELLQAQYTFIFLRNPFTRLASYFLDKLAWQPGFASDLSYEGARRLFPKPTEDLSFRTFVNTLWSHPEKLEQDEHMRPQIDFLVYEDYDDWFSLEDYSEAVRIIKDRIGLEIIDTRALSSHTSHSLTASTEDGLADRPVRELQEMRRSGYTPSANKLYDEDLAFKVASLYYSDIALYCHRIGKTASMSDYLRKCRGYALIR